MQEVAIVIADDRYIAADGVEAVEVEYEELPVVMDPYAALEADAPVLRDLAGKNEGAGPQEHHNHIFTWEAGDKSAADDVFASAPVTVSQHMLYPRVHPCPLETCGCVAVSIRSGRVDYLDDLSGTARCQNCGLNAKRRPRVEVRIISPDIVGASETRLVSTRDMCVRSFLNCSGQAGEVVGRQNRKHFSTAFARDYHMDGHLAATEDGKILGLKVDVVADHGVFDACADPTKFPAGLFHICSGSYDIWPRTAV